MPMFPKQMMVVLAIALAAIVGTIYGTSSDEIVQLDSGDNKSRELNRVNEIEASDLSTPDKNKKTPSTEKIFVYVTGAVNNPGMVELKGSNLHVADAINASGGLLPTALVEELNMAEPIKDGQHIRVPEKIVARSIETTEQGNQTNDSSTDGLVNINTAGVEELDTLPGIGPAMAQRIIDYRELNGAFKSIDEIQNVRGIGAKKFENLKSRIKI